MNKDNQEAIIRTAIAEDILRIFSKQPTRAFNHKQISGELGMRDAETRELVSVILEELHKAEKIEQVDRGKYKCLQEDGYAEGRIQITSTGEAYVKPDSTKSFEVYIPPHRVRQALDGDTVKVFMYARRKSNKPEGEVIEIIKRGRENYVGTLRQANNIFFMVPDHKNMKTQFVIPISALAGAKEGEKIQVQLKSWPANSTNPIAEVVKVFGLPGENETEINAIMAQYELPMAFPSEVEAEAKKIKTTITKAEIEKRTDFRKICTFTIDPVDAKDFDDALSIQQLPTGLWEVGVHIADVSHYVQPDSLLDKEALTRATSVYLVDRVVPMLPEKLSNELCSLRPNEDKLCFSAVFHLDNDGNIHEQWFGKTIIHSIRRFTYEEAQEIIETGNGDLKDEILKLHEIAQKLRKARFKNGAISFEKKEVKFQLDDKGAPIGIYTKISKDSNKLIEEFMLLANKKVAESIGKVKKNEKAKTFVYRIHDEPSADKLADFSAFAKQLGYKLQINSGKEVAKSLNRLVEEIRGRAEQNVLETLAIRTMAKAEYSVDNIGHYGLAFDFYTHFTSPIRRYPDVLVHRLLEEYLAGGKSAPYEAYSEMCQHSTEREIKAAQAERDSIKYKQVEYLQNKLGIVYDGFISGVTEWGLYVEFENGSCEGMIRLRDLEDDYYEFEEGTYSIKGKRTKKVYRLGDSMQIIVAKADLLKKQIDLLPYPNSKGIQGVNGPKFGDSGNFSSSRSGRSGSSSSNWGSGSSGGGGSRDRSGKKSTGSKRSVIPRKKRKF